MTLKKAVKILEQQKAKVDDPSHYNDENWVFQTASYITDFFGSESTEYSFISQVKFGVIASSYDSDESISMRIREKPKQVKKYLDNCIETLQNKGLKKQPNFLQRFNDSALWTSISIIIPALCGLGFMAGKYTSDVQNFELKQEVKALNDTVKVLQSKRLVNATNKFHTTIKKEVAADTIK